MKMTEMRILDVLKLLCRNGFKRFRQVDLTEKRNV